MAHHSNEKFGFPVDMVSVGRSYYEIVKGRTDVIYSFLSKEYVSKHYTPIGDPMDFMAEVWDKESLKRVMGRLIGRLQENAEAI